MKKHSRNCSASNCSSRKIVGRIIPAFFRFPLDEERCKIWCLNSGRNDLLDKLAKELHKRNYLCSKHFQKNQFVNVSGKKIKRLRLTSSAVPSNGGLSEETTTQKERKLELSLDLNQSSVPSSESMIETMSQTCSSVEKKEPEQPYLEVQILHNGYNHDAMLFSDSTFYKYKDRDGRCLDIDMKGVQNDIFLDDTEEDFHYATGTGVFTVKKSLINQFRRENHYYGPLKVTPEVSVISEDGILNETYSSRLEAVDFSVTRNDDRSVSESELDSLMHQTPGIIPSCKPPPKGDDTQEDDFTLFSRLDKHYKVCNKAIAVFKELSGLHTNLELKSVDEIFQTSFDRGTLIPVTILLIGEKRKARSGKSILMRQKKRKMKLLRKKNRILKMKKAKKEENGLHSYDIDYINWSRRGSTCFSDIRRVGIKFIDQLLTETLVDGELKDFATRLSSTAQLGSLDDYARALEAVAESTFPAGSKENMDEVWYFLCNSVKSDNTLLEFQYGMEDEKWIEVKRTFNLFQIDGESVSDITLKVVARSVNNIHQLTYYFRCLSRLVKTGTLSLKSEVTSILTAFQRDKYICIGLDKDIFLYQTDENEMLRKTLKQNGSLSVTPFESIRSRKCDAVVRDDPDLENHKFERGDRAVQGTLVVCKPCQALADQLGEFIDPSLNCSLVKHPFTRCKPRFGPVQSVKVKRNIVKLCTETPFEFVSDAQLEQDNRRILGIDFKKSAHVTLDLSDDEKPSVHISEKEFESIVVIKKSSGSGSGRLQKACDKCGFEAKTMLSLFTHMSEHVGSSRSPYLSRAVVSSKEIYVCEVCEHTCFSSKDFFYHMSSHRSTKAFICMYCDQRYQTIEAYKKHMKTVHHMETIEDMNFGCDMCRTYFYTHDHLMIHCLNENHVDNVSIKCRICHASCDSVPSLQTHILNHTYDQRECHNSAICLECKTIFFSSYELEDHTKREHGDLLIKQKEQIETEMELDKTVFHKKEFQCGRCFKVYGTLNVLEKHFQDSHPENTEKTGEEATGDTELTSYSLACNLCGAKFNSDYLLGLHMNLHATNRQTFPTEDLSCMYTAKRVQPIDQIIRIDSPKHPGKHQHIIQEQQQQQVTYNQLFTTQQSAPFTEGGQVAPEIAGQSQVITATSSDAAWTQQANAATLDETQDSVYSLLHL